MYFSPKSVDPFPVSLLCTRFTCRLTTCTPVLDKTVFPLDIVLFEYLGAYIPFIPFVRKSTKASALQGQTYEDTTWCFVKRVYLFMTSNKVSRRWCTQCGGPRKIGRRFEWNHLRYKQFFEQIDFNSSKKFEQKIVLYKVTRPKIHDTFKTILKINTEHNFDF